ncbi:DUF4352 domain-containing protein [Actinoallomurus rhizosphaericola]|uniref:DUF4352 domain-containing protein n=1 Tax=Actinoallomurus rhizosphaericola TaxID=2952536 RepID=UPI002091949B|nr:DUF4352 domain-containing protein [Actinoallomurus rhizosphaericola]MCO5994068.1 DUF4352 domain-containing protein [Actinoallomurus rhizosphaericola]
MGSGVVRRLALTAAVTAALLAGCGNAARTANNPQTATPSPTPRVRQVTVGQTVTLSGADDSGGAGRLRLAVKVKQVLPTATGHGAFQKPRKGERFVAVRFVLKNVGDTAYDDSPTYGANVVDTAGRTYDPTVAAVTAGPGFPKVVRLRQGQAASGFMVFAVPKKAKVVAVAYALNAGFATDRAEWRVP